MSEKPNVIIINCDDLGYGDLGCYGSTLHNTPTIDRMAQEGIKFTDFYVSASLCTPSRASLLTGSYPKRIGCAKFLREDRAASGVLFPGDAYGLNPEEVTIAQLLKEQGYSTQLIGKWHCGDQAAFLPTEFGFDDYLGIPFSNDMGINFVGEDKADFRMQGDFNLYEYLRSFPPLPLMNNSTVIEEQPDQASLTERYTQEALKFIRTNKNDPFFLYFAHMYVHTPIFAPDEFLKKSRNGQYGAAVESIDWSTEQILNELKASGIDDNTIVFFTSDNGSDGIMGGSNAPLRGFKATSWEGGFRVPCIVRWPGMIPSDKTTDKVATIMDFLPTIARFAGADVPKEIIIDGRDISGFLTGADADITGLFYYYHKDRLHAVREGDWKYFTDSPDYPEALYNLKNDISESIDLKNEYPDIVEEMKKLLDDARHDMGDDLKEMTGINTRPSGKIENPQPLTVYNKVREYVVSEYDMDDVVANLIQKATREQD